VTTTCPHRSAKNHAAAFEGAKEVTKDQFADRQEVPHRIRSMEAVTKANANWHLTALQTQHAVTPGEGNKAALIRSLHGSGK
jgi:hypothetical protein